MRATDGKMLDLLLRTPEAVLELQREVRDQQGRGAGAGGCKHCLQALDS